MFRKFTAVAVSGALAFASVAVAGETAKVELTAVKGAVQLSHGGKIAPARIGALKAGDRVIAQEGEARLAYADGCVVTLKPRSMATIAETSPCVSGQGLVNTGVTSAQFGEMSGFQVVMGILAVGGFLYGVGSLISNANEDDDPAPVSP